MDQKTVFKIQIGVTLHDLRDLLRKLRKLLESGTVSLIKKFKIVLKSFQQSNTTLFLDKF